jgi:hypothetical protein
VKPCCPGKIFQNISAILAAGGLITLAGCGGGTGSTNNSHVVPPVQISVALQPAPPSTMAVTAVTRVGATTVNDSANGGLSWSCSPAGSCGSFGSSTTASGATTMYTAPATIPSGGKVTVTATSVSDSGASASATITISSTPSANFFVSPSGNDTWSGRLPAPNTNNTDGPFATIARAQTAIQGLKAGSTQSLVVIVRAGTYFLASPLTFTAADSGTSAVNIYWENYLGEAPVISGGLQLTNWTQSGNQWSIKLLAGTQYFEQLFYNGQRRLRSRQGGSVGTYLQVANTIYLPGSSSGPAPDPNCSIYVTNLGWECFDRFQYTSTDPVSASWQNLSPPSGNPCGASGNAYPAGDIALYSFEQMGTSKMLIDCIDATNSIIYLTGPIRMDAVTSGFVTGHRYLVENVKDDFTQPGQWFLDRSQTPWTLNYIANSGENPNTDTVIIPQMPTATPQVLIATGLQYVTFQGLTFEHDNFTVPAAGYAYDRLDQTITSAVSCQNCQNVTFDADIITQTSGTGIDFTTIAPSATTANNSFVNGAIYDVASHGIRIGLLSANSDSAANVPQFTTVQNTLIEGFGRVFPKGFGIAQGCNHDNLYTNNDIYDGYSGGINIGALNCPTATISFTSNDVASFNNIYDLGQGVSNDFGCVYFNTTPIGAVPPTGNQALNNICHDVTDSSVYANSLPGVAGYGGQGMYLDNNSGSVNVENNLVYRVSGSTVAQTCGPQGSNLTNVQNTIKNNILAFSIQSIKQQGCTPADSTNKLFDMTNNLIIFDKGNIQGGCFSCLSGNCATVLPATVNLQSNMYCYAGNGGSSCTLPTNRAAFYSSEDLPNTSSNCGRTTTYSTLQQWQTDAGEDLSSVLQNPFSSTSSMSPANNDYSLSGSASAVGFVSFDASQAGRTNSAIAGPTIPATFPTQSFDPSQF